VVVCVKRGKHGTGEHAKSGFVDANCSNGHEWFFNPKSVRRQGHEWGGDLMGTQSTFPNGPFSEHYDIFKSKGLFQLWAKTTTENRWHALQYHLLDVIAAAEALWDRLTINSRTQVMQIFGNEIGSRNIVVFLAGAHDVGKANRYFQAKEKGQADRLIHFGFDLSCLNEPTRHGQATGAYLKPWLMAQWNWSCLAAETVALAVGGHHGTFFENTKQSILEVNISPWCELGPAILDTLAEILQVETPVEPKLLNPILGWLSGFVSVADWLGSHEAMTVWEIQERPLVEYLQQARHRAHKLLDDLHWQIPPVTSILPIANLLPAGCIPNSLQQLSADIASDFSLAIIEAPTGEGKTEAAFTLVEPTRSTGEGVFFALPTMATANGLYDRVKTYLQKATGNNDLEARLLHSQAWLFREKAETAQNPGQEGIEQEIQAQDWFAGSKRGLLAPFGVGTIDQALIAALRAKHGFVRLFALAGKTVVIDEVHAYDVYMADLLEVLLGWLRALGCRVILLSATLPNVRRKSLLHAWGAKGEPLGGQYPCITWITEEGNAHARGFKVQPRKPLIFEFLPETTGNSWEKGASHILERIRKCGGLGVLVLNTVRDAQNAYDWLQRQNLNGIQIDLFHARFTTQDRNIIEKQVLDRFGKYGRRDKPAILVATQVVEQSLDLDFDHMVTSLAPIDLLIQRAGRLHRHRRYADGKLREDNGIDLRPDPVMEILSPSYDEEGMPIITDPVYSHDVLMRTLQRLRTNSKITQSSDVADAIEAVYGESERSGTILAWEHKLKQLEEKTAIQTQQQRQQAERATIGAVEDNDHLIVEAFLDLDENDERQGSQLAARTRLQDRPSITVVLLHEENGRLLTIHEADPANLRDAMFACINISPPYPLWEALLAIEPLDAWCRKGSLSHAHPLVLSQGQTQIADYEISYMADRGLDWRTTHADV
jgi:CRISPR-associated endonuclease/helicase Cas3